MKTIVKAMKLDGIYVSEGDIVSIQGYSDFLSKTGKIIELNEDTFVLDYSEKYQSKVLTIQYDSISKITLQVTRNDNN